MAGKRTAGFRPVREDEQVMATLENGMIKNMLIGDGIVSKKAVVTDRRLYVTQKKGILFKRNKEERVNIRDITGTEIVEVKNNKLFLLSIFAVAAGVISCFLVSWIVGLLILLGAAGAYGMFYISRKKYLRIEYAGGVIEFSIVNQGMDRVRRFQSIIYQLQDLAA